MDGYFDELQKDIDNFNLPEDTNAIDKIKGMLLTGKRFYWYYQEDLDFFKEEECDIKDYLGDIFSGIVVPRPGIYRPYEIDVEDAIVICDNTPTEMDEPEVEWITLGRILNNPDLVEFFEEVK